ncbi:ATP-binding protein, partial [Anaerolinea sp.]|uniref:ATP-binding protein n=1 Tax=Anaerolinea sp. TaxID=1872519 RepID=UPI002ACE2DA7
EFLSDLEVFGSTAPLVGRETEFARLRTCLDRLRAGQGGTVLLTGEVGIGKHALVNELRQLTIREQALLAETGTEHSSVLWLSSRTHIYDRDWPYSLWIELLRNWLAKFSTEDGDSLLLLRRECERLWGEDFLSYYPYLARILSLPLEEEFEHFVQYLDAESLRFQFTHSIRGWLEALSRQQPLVVSLTDLEWSDFGSVDILEACLSLAASQPILWILVFRPCLEQSPICHLIDHLEDLDPGPVERVELGPLSPENVARLIEALVGKDVLPVRLLDQIVRNSEGIPSYVIEMLRSLIERRILIRQGATGEWRLNQDVQSLDFTESMQRLIQTRIDRLESVERDLLQKAAVIGYVFWVNLLRGLVEETVPVRQHLRVLQDAQLIEQRGWEKDLGTEYAFKTELIHETVYESLLTGQREALHIQVAQLLEEMVDLEARSQFHALIAYHYRKGGAKRQELFYTLWAAQKAEELSAPEEATELYSRVLELLDQIEKETTDIAQSRSILNQRFEAYSGRIKLYYRLNEPEKAAQDARALLTLAQQM